MKTAIRLIVGKKRYIPVAAFFGLVATLIFFVIVFQSALSAAAENKKNKNQLSAGTFSTTTVKTSSAVGNNETDYNGAIISALKNPASEVRLRALEIIRERPARFPAEKIKEVLSSPNEKDVDVKIHAAITLAAMNDKSGASYLRSLAFKKPQLSSSPTVAERVKYFNAQNTRIKAIVNLGRIKDFSSQQFLLEETKSDDGRVADAAWIALAYLGDKKGVDIFVYGLKNSDKAVRARAAEVVGDIGAIEGLTALRERLSDWDKEVKIAAIHSVAKLKDVQSAPKLRDILLSDKEQSVREAAAHALGEIGDTSQENLTFLKRYISDENIAVRLSVCHSLAKLGDYSGKDFVKALAERGAEKEARYSAVRALGDFALDDEDKKFLSNLIYDEDPLTSLEALKILAYITGDKK